MALIKNVIESFYSNAQSKGLPLGNLTSQLLVNIYMNEFDQFAKHTLKARYYIRYADDFLIMSDDKTWLQYLIPKISHFLSTNLFLSLHPNKVSIGTCAAGIDFLGWIHFQDHRILRGSTKRRIVRTLAMDRNKDRITSYQGLVSHGNAHKFSKQYLQNPPKV